MLTNDQLAAWDRDAFLHPSTHWADHARGTAPGRIMTTGEGAFVTDRDGNRMLDAFAGLYCVNIGYGRREVVDAIADQAEKLAFYHTYAGHSTEASITLAKMVLDRAPDHMSKVYFGQGGSDANETNAKIVWYYNNVLGRPEKRKIISRWRAYHGAGVVSGSMTGLPLFHKAFNLPLPGFLHTTAPYYFRREDRTLSEEAFSAQCAADLEALIEAEGADTIAAFVAEPVIGTGGIVPPPEGYWPAISAVLKKHDILLVADEVVTGFGRLGTMFASPYFGLEPDIMTIAKGLTSAYAPLSGSIISDKLWRVLEKGSDELGPMGHGWTYSAHPIGAAAGVANLKVLDAHGMIDNAAEIGPYLTQGLREAMEDHPHVGDVRGIGMLSSVELVADRESLAMFAPEGKVLPRVIAAMGKRGVIARAMPMSDTIGFAPPLCLTRAEADTIVAVTRDA
ncbi:MAG: aminotransferase, partial [Pseudomonadota bacterium]